MFKSIAMTLAAALSGGLVGAAAMQAPAFERIGFNYGGQAINHVQLVNAGELAAPILTYMSADPKVEQYRWSDVLFEILSADYRFNATSLEFLADRQLCMQGATDDAFNLCYDPGDPSQDIVVDVPDAASGVVTIGDITIPVYFGATPADHLDTIVFVADRAYILTKVDATWGIKESTGAMDIMVQKLVGVTACGSGTDMLSAVIDAGTASTADTTTAGSLHGTPANLAIAVGDTLCIDLTATPNEIANMVVTLALKAN